MYNKFDMFVNDVMFFVYPVWFSWFDRFFKWTNVFTSITHDNRVNFIQTMTEISPHRCLLCYSV